ncbi:MAG: viroplasmin family protein [Negativicutes bacterium]
MTKIKFYAVKAGRVPGIYKTWSECQKQTVGYSGAIFKSFPTEQEARTYINNTSASIHPANNGEKEEVDKKWYDVYVDGSFNGVNYGWAFAVFLGEDEIYRECGVGTNPEAAIIRNVAGELAATMRAIQWADKQKIPIIIHHDYTGIAAWAKGEWKAKNTFTQAYAQFVQPYLPQIKFYKVAGHSGVKGNELVDRLAGEALKKETKS